MTAFTRSTDPTTTTPPPRAMAQRDLEVTGALDAACALALRPLVTQAIQDGPALVLVDVTGITTVNPSGLVGVLELLRLTRARGGDLRLYGSSMTVLEAQTVAQLTQVARVYGGRQAAVEAGTRRPQPTIRVRRRRRSFHDRVARLQARLRSDAQQPGQSTAADGVGSDPRAADTSTRHSEHGESTQ